jgi:hypothetical protein
MTEYTKETYLAACAALFEGKPTETFFDGQWRNWRHAFVPAYARDRQWRAVDPLREYKEALEAGKRVEWQGVRGDWYVVVPKADAERVALLERIAKTIRLDDVRWGGSYDLLRDIRAYLTKGW